MAVLEPKLAILDETDSGLDIDALRIVADGVNALRAPERAHARHHPLPAAARLHRAGLRARAGRRPHRPVRRQGAGARARGAAATTWLDDRSAPTGRAGGRDLHDARELATADGERFARLDPRLRGLPACLARRRRASARSSASPSRASRPLETRTGSYTQRGAIADARVRGRAARGLPGLRCDRGSTARRRRGGHCAGLRQRPLRAALSRSARCPPASTVGSLAEALASAPRASSKPLFGDAEPRRGVRRAQHRLPADGAFIDLAARRDPRRSRSTSCSSPPRTARLPCPPAQPDRRRRQAARRRSSRHYARRIAGAVLHQRGDRDRRSATAPASTTASCRTKPRPRSTSAVDRCARRHAARLHLALDVARRRAGAQRHRTSPRRRRRPSARSTASTCADGDGSTSTTTRVIDHAQPRCTSRELYKGMLDGTARARVQRPDHRPPGRAEDRRAARRTATCCCRRRAEVDTKPQLEIYADDVKCTHGATVGQLDDDALFYLRSRGIDEARRAQPADLRLRQRGRWRGSTWRRCAARWSSCSRARLPRAESCMETQLAMSALRCAEPARPRRRRGCASDFPILSRTVHGKPLVYLDNAATTPEAAGRDRRDRATTTRVERQHPPRRALPEPARDRRVRRRARDACALHQRRATPSEIVFTRGTTEAINLVAQSYGRPQPAARATRSSSPRIEHHSNIVPWQMLCEQTRRDAAGRADRRRAASSISTSSSGCSTRARRIVAVAHVSNALGTINPVREIIAAGARQRRRWCWSTARRRSPHLPVDVQALDCDFYAFSGHKMYGPTGIGVLYGQARAARGDAAVPGRRRHDPHGHVREDHLQRRCRTGSRPARRNIAGAIGLGAAHRLPGAASASTRIARARARAARATPPSSRARLPGLRLIGTAPDKARGAVVRAGRRPPARHRHDPRPEGVAVRTGHHCAQPVMDALRHARPPRAPRSRSTTRADGRRRAGGRGVTQGAGGVSADDRSARALPGGHPRPQPQAAQLRPRCARPTTAPRATTRCAATS